MARSETPAIRLRQVRKHYRLYASPKDRLREALHPLRRKFHTLHHALKTLDLDVPGGETLGILGRNGAGKSTLLKLITGTLTPTFGSVETEGRIASLLELGAGFNTELTGRENIFFAGAIMGFSQREMQGRVDEIVDFADIGQYIDQPVKTYSSGMFARLAFAVNTCVDPDIFIVDEALAVGDAAFVHRCMLRFHDMQRAGKTILLVTHDATMVKQLCTRALWLDEGELRMDGEAAEVADAYLLDIHSLTRMAGERDGGPRGGAKAVAPAAASLHETVIPHIDKRVGSGHCLVVGAGIYDTGGNPVSAVAIRSTLRMRVTFEMREGGTGAVVVGYFLRDGRGRDLASYHSLMSGEGLDGLAAGEKATAEIDIDIPLVHPGQYSLSPTIALSEDGGQTFDVCDQVYNALSFEIISDEEMYTPVRFETRTRFVR